MSKKIITKSDVENNYEFKIVRGALKKEFPFIVDVSPAPEEKDLNNYHTVLLVATLDPEEIKKAFGWTLNPWVESQLDSGLSYTTALPSVMFTATYDEVKDKLIEPVSRVLDAIRRTSVIPDELKFNNVSDRFLSVIEYEVDPV